MLRRFSIDFAIFSMLVDGLLISLALWLSLQVAPAVRATLPFLAPWQGQVTIQSEVYPIVSAVWVLTFLFHGVYDSRSNFRVVDEINCLVTGTLMAVMTEAGLLYMTYRSISREVVVLSVLITFGLVLLFRLAYRLGLRLEGAPRVKQRSVLVAGAGPVGIDFAKRISGFHSLGLAFVGFLDDRKSEATAGYPVLGNLGDVRSIVIEQKIDDVVMALPVRAFERRNQVVAELYDLPVKVWIIPDYYSLTLSKAHIEEMAGIQMIDLRAPALNDYQRMVKRGFDTIVTLLVMPLALPLMAVIALLIRLEGPGPILFKQKRAGENGRLFEMLKFRSMVTDAEKHRACIEYRDADGRLVQDKRLKDPRITRVGAMIRKTSLDELPQLFNVLRGEMSLVGPRPELPNLVEQYQPWQRSRFAIPQGITGWWQVNGRSDKPMSQHSDEDIYYIQHYSIWLDIKILIKTVTVVLRGRGAY